MSQQICVDLSDTVCGTFLWQPSEANTRHIFLLPPKQDFMKINPDRGLVEPIGAPSITYRSVSHSVMSINCLRLARLHCPWNSPDKDPGVGSQSFLQEIFPTQGSNPGLPDCQQILYPLSHQGSSITYTSGQNPLTLELHTCN